MCLQFEKFLNSCFLKIFFAVKKYLFRKKSLAFTKQHKKRFRTIKRETNNQNIARSAIAIGNKDRDRYFEIGNRDQYRFLAAAIVFRVIGIGSHCELLDRLRQKNTYINICFTIFFMS